MKENDDILTNPEYICASHKIIVDALRNNQDVAQLSNGNLVITEVKTINTSYIWNKEVNRLIKSEVNHKNKR
jgi:hypothetical protein